MVAMDAGPDARGLRPTSLGERLGETLKGNQDTSLAVGPPRLGCCRGLEMRGARAGAQQGGRRGQAPMQAARQRTQPGWWMAR